MKIIRKTDVTDTDREVFCPKGDFTSNRLLLEKDGMGYSISITLIPAGTVGHWHYKNHLESCYCINGHGILLDVNTNERHQILPGTLYVLDKNDEHKLMSNTHMTLLCVFNPPLKGKEVHLEDGSYE